MSQHHCPMSASALLHCLPTCNADRDPPYVLLQAEAPWVCAAACQLNPLCTGFDYNKQMARCTLQRGAGGEVEFSEDGWQSFWHEDHFQEWEQRDHRPVKEIVRSFFRQVAGAVLRRIPSL